MELVIQILMLFILMTTALKLSLKSYPWHIGYALLCATFLVYIYPHCTEQTKPGVEAYIAIRSLREHAALFISLEVLMWIAYCFTEQRSKTQQEQCHQRSWQTQVLSFLLDIYPGFLLFPILFYVQTQLFFVLAGTSFEMISYSLALAIALVFPLLVYGINYLLPEKELRRELLFLSSLILFALGLVMTVDEQLHYQPSPNHYSTMDIALALIIFALCFVTGMYSYYIQELLCRAKATFSKLNKH